MTQLEEVIRDQPVRLALAQIQPSLFKLRLEPPNPRHIETLAQLNGNWPPILVSAHDHRVIDGEHRFMAARRLNFADIPCYLFHGDQDAAFLEAVRLNCGQGLTLTLKERELAASRVIESHRDWSDRRIGAACGLSPTTIGRLRLTICPGPTVHSDQLDTRSGRDQRLRPLDGAAMRRRVIAELEARPHASLREIASVAHCSPETVRSVRKSLVEEGWDAPGPVLEAVPDLAKDSSRSPDTIDYAFISTLDGAAFKRWFETTYVDDEESRKYVMSVPLSRVYEVADAAMQRSVAWREFARALEARVRTTRF